MYHGLNPCNSLAIGDKLTDLMPAAEQNINKLVHLRSAAISVSLVSSRMVSSI